MSKQKEGRAEKKEKTGVWLLARYNSYGFVGVRICKRERGKAK